MIGHVLICEWTVMEEEEWKRWVISHACVRKRSRVSLAGSSICLVKYYKL